MVIDDTDGSQFVKQAIENLRGRMTELYEDSESICKLHLDFVLAENRSRTWEGKSLLFVKPRLRDNTLTVTWYEVRWYGSKVLNTRRMEKKVIVKPKGKYGYTMDTLLKQAQPWEANMVSDVELALIPIRHEAEFIAAAIGKLNRIIKLQESKN